MARSSAFITLALVICCFVATVAAVDRNTLCGSDSDCVMLKTRKGSGLKIDGLALETDTVSAILEKLPSWFGPRPADFVHLGSRLLNEHETLSEQGVGLGDVVMMYKAGKWDEL